MVRSVLLAVALSLLTGAAMAQPVEQATAEGPLQMSDRWSDPDLGGAIVEGAATSTSLWLRGASGKVVRFDLPTGERSVVAEDVVDILPDGPHLWALVQSSRTEGRVRDLRAAGPAARQVYPEGGLVALFQTPDGPGILTADRILMPAGEHWRRSYVAGRLEMYGHVSPLTHGSVFIGYNKGEWSGGLRRLETSTGTVSFVREPGERILLIGKRRAVFWSGQVWRIWVAGGGRFCASAETGFRQFSASLCPSLKAVWCIVKGRPGPLTVLRSLGMAGSRQVRTAMPGPGMAS